MKNYDVCLSPDLLHLFNLDSKIVVVVDILRATSCMVTGLANGVKSIIPVATLEECREFGKRGFITAAERDGKKEAGFDIGNSPFSYLDPSFVGKSICVTTTNGTKAIKLSVQAKEIVIGSFLNISAISTYLNQRNHDVLILCAGWKGQVNAEDTLFAGALGSLLKETFYSTGDAALLAQALFSKYQANPMSLIEQSSHYHRLKNLGIHEDIQYCLTWDTFSVVPVYDNGEIILRS